MSAISTDFARAASEALREDLADGPDVTSQAVIDHELEGEGVFEAKQDGVICGLEAILATYSQLDGSVEVEVLASDSEQIRAPRDLARVKGPVRTLLTGERAALNLLGHLSGIASLTKSFVDLAPGVWVTDTRKTLPGLRALQKYAVTCGGGNNHRMSLSDAVLIKDNHLVATTLFAAVKAAKEYSDLVVQVECETQDQVADALEAGADAVLLDNLSPRELRKLVTFVRTRKPDVLIEASGGVTLETVASIASTGVDRISVGALTHSAPALDVGFRLVKTFTKE